jgi:hypothetical protein
MIQSSGYPTLKHYPLVMSQTIGQDIYKKYNKVKKKGSDRGERGYVMVNL